MIPESFVQDLLDRVDIVDVVGKYVQLRKGGVNLMGLCPFHNEKSPSFTVSPSKQFYHCFGCGAHGTAIRFMMEHTGAPFPEAVRSLAASIGLVVPEEKQSPAQQAATKERQAVSATHHSILDKAQHYYFQQLKASAGAIAYLKKRGLSGQTAKRFGLGWSGDARQGLKTVFDNYNDPLLIESGLIIESEDGRRYDRFRERVMFPIYNARGQLIGFGGRLIDKGEPKYLNSPETPVFNKGQELYGLWENRRGIHTEKCVLVVEGYMDVVSLAQQGIENAVATLGTATTDKHIQKLMRASDRIIFSFDGDKAGKNAAWKALNASLPLLRDDVALRFLFLPTEHDPDSFVRDLGAHAFREEMQKSLPLSAFFLAELANRFNLNEAEGRAACVHESLALLTQIPESVLKTQIESEFARIVRLTPQELAQLLEAELRKQEEKTRLRTAGGATHQSTQMDAAPSFDATYSSNDRSAGKKRAYQPYKPASTGRMVTSMAKRLLMLLVNHPQLINEISDHQLEILSHDPHFDLVKEFVAFALTSGARTTGALMQAAPADSEIAQVILALGVEDMTNEVLPSPSDEWRDAVRRIELSNLDREKLALVKSGLASDVAKARYQALSKRISLINLKHEQYELVKKGLKTKDELDRHEKINKQIEGLTQKAK